MSKPTNREQALECRRIKETFIEMEREALLSAAFAKTAAEDWQKREDDFWAKHKEETHVNPTPA